MPFNDDIEELKQELGYYRRRVDELAGENLKLDYLISGLRHDLRQKRLGFAMLSDLQQSIGAEQEISKIFEVVIEAINAKLGMDRSLVLSPTVEEHRYRASHWIGFHGDVAVQLPSRTLTLPPDLGGRSGFLIVNKATPRNETIDYLTTAFGLPYFICVPIPGGDGPIGLLLSGRLKENKPLYPPLDQGDADTFKAIAGLVAAVVRNMRLAVLEEMDRIKTEFFANISHEFRTPIALTVGPLEQILLGRYGEVLPSVRGQLTTMRRNQERLLSLVNQILDLAKIEAGGMQLKVARVPDINRWIRERVAQFDSAAEERGIQLRMDLDPGLGGEEVYADLELLDKLFLNLMSNALKFTHRGFVEVKTGLVDNSMRIAVADTGIGIREDQLPFVFDRFRQVDGSEAREYAGTGIGLALVREVARLHGGEATVFSEYGKGSEFQVSIPLGRAHLPPDSISDAGSTRLPMHTFLPAVGLDDSTDAECVRRHNERVEAAFDPARPSVLYAEDNPDLRSHVRDILADEVNLFLARDGRDGLEQVRRYRPDVLITDQMMPVMSGRDLLRAVRNDPEIKATPVIFLTARVGTEARIESLDAGADDYLTKPFHHAELSARVRNLVRARKQERELSRLNLQLEARIEDQMAELLRTGELKRFLPQSVVEQLLQRDSVATEPLQRRKITILFADLASFTDLADLLEPEELAALLNEFLREMTSVAVKFDGTVDKFIGDGLMVIFGAPVSSDPQTQAWQAVQAGMQMRSATKDLSVGWRRRGIPCDAKVRVGINTGFCTVGVFGSDLLQSYTAVGTPVNIAARLQTEAQEDEVLCSFATHALVDGRVQSASAGLLTLRGIARPVDAFRVYALNTPSS